MKNVKKQYGTFFYDCTMEVPHGRITGLIGVNGSGKSTTFKALLDLTAIESGEIELLGKRHTDLTAADKQKLGVVLSDSGFSKYLTVRDVADIMENMYTEFGRQDFLHKCAAFGLPEKKKIKEFSTGMRAKLKLLSAMSHGAEFLLLDEPTAGLDAVARGELLGLLQDYLEERVESSVLISSHIAGDLEKICDDVYMIHDGKIIMHEETDVLLSDYAILKADEQQYAVLDKTWILQKKKEPFGYSLLTDQKQFYRENYPHMAIEKCGMDELILMMACGERWKQAGNAAVR